MTRPWATVLLVQITLSGCASLVKLPEFSGDVRGELPIQAYARVLHKYVNDRGEVDFPVLRRDRADLERYLAYVARTPENCGCFGAFLARPLRWSSVAEDVALMAVSALGLRLLKGAKLAGDAG